MPAIIQTSRHPFTSARRVALAVLLLAALLLIALTTLRTTGTAAAYSDLTKGSTVQHLTLPGGTLAYDDQGSGPLVIMLPGLGDLRQQYRLLAPKIAQAGYRVITVDLRGHGESSTDWPEYSRVSAGHDLLALIEHLDAGPAAVIATSFASAAAVWAAAEQPEVISSLSLIGPFVRVHETPLHMQLLMRAMFNGPWKVSAWSWYYSTLYPTKKPADFAAYQRALGQNLSEPGRFQAVQAMLFSSEPEIETRLVDVQAPSLVLMGSKDPDFPDPAAEANWIAQQLRGTAEMIEGAGHYPHTEMPETTAPIILDFLKGLKRAP